jgi:Holliday junction DNA helicase RuvB
MNEVNDVQPTSLKHLESDSQKSMHEMVKVALDVSFQDSQRFPHASLVGSPGLGKSVLANVIASELCVPFKEVLGQTLRTPADLNALLLGATEKSIVFVDESDTLPIPIQTALYLALDKKMLFLSSGGSVQSLPLADFTLLLATTEEYGMLQPLRDRCRLTLRFQFYSEEDLVRMIRNRAKNLNWTIDPWCVAPIARRSRGTPRIAFNLLQSCRLVSRSEGEDTIRPVHMRKAFTLSGIDSLGLNVATDLKYLTLLLEGEKPVNVLASHLSLPLRTLTSVIEPFLIRSGLMEKGKQSKRYLTPKGKEHLTGGLTNE